MKKWVKFPLLFGIIFAVLGIFFRPLKIFNIEQKITTIFNIAGILEGFIIGIIIGLVIAIFVKKI